MYFWPSYSNFSYNLKKSVEFSNQKAIGTSGTIGICSYSCFWGEDKSTGNILVPSHLPNVHLQSHRQQDSHDPGMHVDAKSLQIDDPNDPEYMATGIERRRFFNWVQTSVRLCSSGSQNFF